jgi:putative transcriptional regulator
MAKKLSKLSGAILEMAGDQYRNGLIDNATHERITLRLLGAQALPTARPIGSKEIRRIREKANPR